MKNCGGCWYFPDIPVSEFYDSYHHLTYEKERGCELTGLPTISTRGCECDVYRPRSLGQPYQVTVDVPEANKFHACPDDCPLLISGILDCILGFSNEGKPGEGCPRHKGEGK